MKLFGRSDLAALGLVGDLARLTGMHATWFNKGWLSLTQHPAPWLQVMMEMADLVPANLTEEHIGFVLGPRLNALGRPG